MTFFKPKRFSLPAVGSIYGTMTLKDEGRSGTLDGYYWVRRVQSGPPLGPSRSKGSEAGCRLSSSSSRRSKCPPPRFVREDRAVRRRSVPNRDSRRVGVAESSRSTRARRGSVDVSEVMFGEPSRYQTAVEAVKDVRSERVVAYVFPNGIRQAVIPQVGRIRSISSNTHHARFHQSRFPGSPARAPASATQSTK
jgi:hypothetical protein